MSQLVSVTVASVAPRFCANHSTGKSRSVATRISGVEASSASCWRSRRGRRISHTASNWADILPEPKIGKARPSGCTAVDGHHTGLAADSLAFYDATGRHRLMVNLASPRHHGRRRLAVNPVWPRHLRLTSPCRKSGRASEVTAPQLALLPRSVQLCRHATDDIALRSVPP